VEDLNGQRLQTVTAGQGIKLVVRYELAPGQQIRNPAISFGVYTQRGAPMTRLYSRVAATEGFADELPPHGRFECLIPRLHLNTGSYMYHVKAEIGPDEEAEDLVYQAGSFTIAQGDFYGTGKVIEPRFPTLTDHSWRLCRE
jgi:hypothetical protein